MNLDVLAALALVAVLALVFWVLWGFVRPHARGRAWQAVRVAGALVAAVVVVGAGS